MAIRPCSTTTAPFVGTTALGCPWIENKECWRGYDVWKFWLTEVRFCGNMDITRACRKPTRRRI